MASITLYLGEERRLATVLSQTDNMCIVDMELPKDAQIRVQLPGGLVQASLLWGDSDQTALALGEVPPAAEEDDLSLDDFDALLSIGASVTAFDSHMPDFDKAPVNAQIESAFDFFGEELFDAGSSDG